MTFMKTFTRHIGVALLVLAFGLCTVGCEFQDLMAATGSEDTEQASSNFASDEELAAQPNAVPPSPVASGNPTPDPDPGPDPDPAPDPDPDPAPDPEPEPDGDPSGIGEQVHNLINQHRQSIGLPALVWSDTVAVQCIIHSENIASGAVPFGHDGFSGRVAAIGQTISWTSAGENVAGAGSASVAVQLWLNSPGHRSNIEGDFDIAGVGVAVHPVYGYVYTQIFIRL